MTRVFEAAELSTLKLENEFLAVKWLVAGAAGIV